MANTIKVKRGLSSNLSNLSLAEGEMAFATDTKKLYISNTDEPINKDTTYSLSKSGSTITLTGSDGSKTTVTDADTNTTYSAATQSAAGLMSAADKTKLDGIATGANKITVDIAMSSSSTNPVQNKVVNAALANKANTSAIPTKVSQLTNDSGFKTTDTNTTYTLSKSGSTITLTGSDGSTNSVTDADTNTTYNVVSTSANGLCPKRGGTTTKFLRDDGTWAVPPDTNTTYSNMTAATSSAAGKAGLVPAPAAGKQSSFLRGDGTWATPTNTTYSVATTSANGLMSSTDKSKLDGIASGANAYTHPSYTARTGKPTANQTPAFGGTATVSQITSDATGHVTAATDRTITIPSTLSNGTGTAGLIKTSSTVTSNSGYTACPVISGVPYYKDTNTTYSAATTSANGLMSSSDKTKLNGIATGAQVNNVVVSTSQPTASTAEVWVNPSGTLDLSALWDKLYPVGSVYMSTSSTNPGTLFGGTWAQITGRFLYCTTESKTTGGSATHTHTGPSHSHTYGIALGAFYGAAGYEGSGYTGVLQNGTGDPAGWASWSSANVTNNANATSSSKTNNNAIQKSTANTGASGTGNTGASSSLPPYFTVYCWYRTA